MEEGGVAPVIKALDRRTRPLVDFVVGVKGALLVVADQSNLQKTFLILVLILIEEGDVDFMHEVVEDFGIHNTEQSILGQLIRTLLILLIKMEPATVKSRAKSFYM